MSFVIKTYLSRTPRVRGRQASYNWTPRLIKSQITSSWRQPSRRVPRTAFCANTSDSSIVRTEVHRKTTVTGFPGDPEINCRAT